MSIGTIFLSVLQAKRKVRKAAWQLRYRTAQMIPSIALLVFLYILFVTLFLISATTVAAERVAGCAVAVKMLAAKWLPDSGCHPEVPFRNLFTQLVRKHHI
jgi:hypothetical protein